MNWITLSLLAPLIYTVVVFVDKFVVEHKVKLSLGMPGYGAISATMFGTIVWLFAGISGVGSKNALLILASGCISMFGFALYFYALAKSQTSYIIALLQTTPLFTLVFSYLLLDERLSTQQLLGFVLVFIAVIGLSVDKVESRLKVDAAFWSILLANVFFALASIVVAYTSDSVAFMPLLALESWGIAIGGAMLLLLVRQVRTAFINSFKTVGRQTLRIVFFNEGLFIFVKALSYFAITLGPVSLVNVLGGTQVFYGFMAGVLLSRTYPKYFKEDLGRRELIFKLCFSMVLFGGILLMSVVEAG